MMQTILRRYITKTKSKDYQYHYNMNIQHYKLMILAGCVN